MKIAIILHEPYPVGMACTNRIHLYARGLIQNGHDVKIIIPKPLEKPGAVKNVDRNGIFEGIPYECTWYTPVRSKNFFVRRFHDWVSPLITGLRVLKLKPDALLVTGKSAYLFLLLKVAQCFVGGVFIKEQSELPFFRQERLTFMQRLWVKYVYRLFDGIIVISDPLQSYFERKIKKGARLLQVPVLVDVDSIYNPAIVRTKKIVYTGPLTQHKDGILTILESFIKIAGDFPDYVLELTGDLSGSPIRKEIERFVASSGISDQIHLLGFLDRYEMLSLLNEAEMLVLAKPENRQTTACFPTKLGEYLATGNPVLVTAVGEIPKFLTDGENAFFSEPDVKSFSKRMCDVLNYPIEARNIGFQGQFIARNCFDYSYQGRRISDFISDYFDAVKD